MHLLCPLATTALELDLFIGDAKTRAVNVRLRALPLLGIWVPLRGHPAEAPRPPRCRPLMALGHSSRLRESISSLCPSVGSAVPLPRGRGQGQAQPVHAVRAPVQPAASSRYCVLEAGLHFMYMLWAKSLTPQLHARGPPPDDGGGCARCVVPFMALYVPLLSSWTSTKNDALAVLLCLSAEWENSGTFEAGATEAALSAVSEAEAVAAVLASLDEAWRCGGGCQAGRWCGAAGDQDGVQHGAVVGVCGGLAAILSCCAGGAMTASQVMVAPAQLGTGTDHRCQGASLQTDLVKVESYSNVCCVQEQNNQIL